MRSYLTPRADDKVRKKASEIAQDADGLYDVIANQVTAAEEVAAEIPGRADEEHPYSVVGNVE